MMISNVHTTRQVNAKLLVAFTRADRYGLALSYFEPVFSAIEAHCRAQASSPGLLMHQHVCSMAKRPKAFAMTCTHHVPPSLLAALAPLAALLPRISRKDAFEADLKFLLGCDPVVLVLMHVEQ